MPEFRALLAGGGEMAERIRAHDWAATPLGPPAGWPQSLRSALSICLHSAFPSAIYWGADFRILHNDAWLHAFNSRESLVLGRPAAQVWPDIWHIVGPQFRSVFADGRGNIVRDQLLPMTRDGRPENSYWDYSMTPIAGEDGSVAGIFNQGRDTSDRIFAQRRAALLLELHDHARQLQSGADIIAAGVAMLGKALGVERVGYGELDPDSRMVNIAPCWTAGGMRDIGGVHAVRQFGDDLHDDLRQGRSYAVEDCHTDPRLTASDRASYAAIGIVSGLVVPVMQEGRYTALVFAHSDRARGWSAHDHELVRDIGGALYHRVARARAETGLRASEEQYRLLFEQAQDMIFTADLDQVITAANPTSALALGATCESIVGRSISEFVSPEAFEQTTRMLRQKLDHGGTTRHDVEVLAADGRKLQWEINSTLAIDSDGKAIGLHAIARDVTERKAFDERQRLLINELNHRVKNTLALVQGLALQSFRGGRDPAEAQTAFQARLTTLAAAHDLLTREKWEGATLSELIADATRPHDQPAGRIAANGPLVVLTPKAAVSLVLAMHELATNAAKYGALSSPVGRVDIGWTRSDADALTISWRESGGPAVLPPEKRGFGLRMIERALANDLGGAVKIDFAAGGLVCTIDASIPVMCARPAHA